MHVTRCNWVQIEERQVENLTSGLHSSKNRWRVARIEGRQKLGFGSVAGVIRALTWHRAGSNRGGSVQRRSSTGRAASGELQSVRRRAGSCGFDGGMKFRQGASRGGSVFVDEGLGGVQRSYLRGWGGSCLARTPRGSTAESVWDGGLELGLASGLCRARPGEEEEGEGGWLAGPRWANFGRGRGKGREKGGGAVDGRKGRRVGRGKGKKWPKVAGVLFIFLNF